MRSPLSDLEGRQFDVVVIGAGIRGPARVADEVRRFAEYFERNHAVASG